MIYHVSRDGVVIGQFTADEFALQRRNRALLPSDYFWREGMSDWKPLSEWQRITPPQTHLFAAPQAIEPLTAREDKHALVLNPLAGFGFAIAAMFLPLVSPMMIFISFGLLSAALVIAILLLTKGRMVAGVALMALLPIATIGSCVSLVDRDEMIKPAKHGALLEKRTGSMIVIGDRRKTSPGSIDLALMNASRRSSPRPLLTRRPCRLSIG